MQFLRFSVLPDSAEARVIRCAILKCLLIAYFIGNICAKKYQNPFTYVKVIASQRWDLFETWCSFFSSQMSWRNSVKLSLIEGIDCRCAMKNSRFSTSISQYLGTIQLCV